MTIKKVQPGTAVFVMDLQSAAVANLLSLIPHGDEVYQAAGVVVSAARSAATMQSKRNYVPPVVVVFVQHEETEIEGPLVRGSSDWMLTITPRDRPGREFVVNKSTADVFKSNPGLAARLRNEYFVDTIYTLGLESDVCVEHTTRGAIDAGFKVALLAGAHSTTNVSNEGNNGEEATQIEREVEDRLRQYGARVIKWEDAVTEWKVKHMH